DGGDEPVSRRRAASVGCDSAWLLACSQPGLHYLPDSTSIRMATFTRRSNIHLFRCRATGHCRAQRLAEYTCDSAEGSLEEVSYGFTNRLQKSRSLMLVR